MVEFFYQQHICPMWWTVDIPLGTNSAPLFSDLYADLKVYHLAWLSDLSLHYIEDMLSLNNTRFWYFTHRIYLIELEGQYRQYEDGFISWPTLRNWWTKEGMTKVTRIPQTRRLHIFNTWVCSFYIITEIHTLCWSLTKVQRLFCIV